ncbi:MAG: polysaccharide biosynthesis tyrosine autokinase [Rhodopseudomonas sp.]|nr:polysaccharide biosynthesis tyrosine autokinase [Rhodopseudomonas sp.]
MLEINKQSIAPGRESEFDDTPPPQDLSVYINIIRRQFPIILLVIACTTALGMIYLFTATPKFSATARMVIDTHKVQLFQQQSSLGDLAADPAMTETQVEILKSENISLSVIKDLHLTDDPEFVGSGGGLIGAVFGAVTSLFSGPEHSASEFELTRRALARFEKQRDIKRVGLTYVMDIEFTSVNAEKAARIANAIADAYIVDQLEAKYQSTKRASIWLQDRIKELRTQATAAQRAVVAFKQKNNIVDTGGRLMTEQQLAEVNSQLIMQRAATAEAKARLDRINEIMKQDIPDASVTDALKNDTIIKLRGQYVDIAAKAAEFASRYGPNHLAVIRLRSQMEEIRRNIAGELERIQQAYKSDYDIALTREHSIKNSLANVVSENQLTNQAQVQLRELDSSAQTYQAMYDNFLQAYMQATQQQSFPITEARLISPASRPLSKSKPKTIVVLALTIAGGLMLSLGIALFRELSDNVFRTSRQIETQLRTHCLAILPVVKVSSVKPPGEEERKRVEPPNSRNIRRAEKLFWHVVDAPFSRFTEAVRSLKVAIDLNGVVKESRIIGITSSLPNEGKSTVSANLAELIAHAGGRVLLMDLDLRNPSLSRSLAPEARGLIDVIAGKVTLTDAVWADRATNLSFLPSGATPKMMHTNEVIASAAMKSLFDHLRTVYDYVIVDLPPLAPVVDVRSTTNIIDSYVYVIEWGRTKIDVVEHNLSVASGVYDHMIGVVLNKADTEVLGRYEGYHSNYYHNKYYARYGYTE